jgi:hypothetical protein
MDLAGVPWGTRRAIHFRGKMWMARQFDMSGLIALDAISLGIIGSQLNSKCIPRRAGLTVSGNLPILSQFSQSYLQGVLVRASQPR